MLKHLVLMPRPSSSVTCALFRMLSSYLITQRDFWRRNTTLMKLLARVWMNTAITLSKSTLVWECRHVVTVMVSLLSRPFTTVLTNMILTSWRPLIHNRLNMSKTIPWKLSLSTSYQVNNKWSTMSQKILKILFPRFRAVTNLAMI